MANTASALDFAPASVPNEPVKAVWLRVRATLGRQRLSAVAVAGIVAIAGGAVLTLAAGARRTASAPATYTASVGGNADALLTQNGGPPLTARVAALPGVRSVQAMTFLFGGIDPESADSTFLFGGTLPYNAQLVAGRDTDPTRSNEFIADETFVARHHAHLGSRYPVVTWTLAQAEHGEGFNAAPKGPSFSAVLVGIIASASRLENNDSVTVFSPALLQHDIGLGETLTAVHLEHGVTNTDLRSELDGLPGGREITLGSGEVVGPEIRNAVDAQALGTWLLAGVLGAAVLIALGQLLSRHTRLSDAERRPLTGVGFTRRQQVAECVVRAAIPAVAGVAVGVALAIALSGRFPVGFVRALEPQAGVHADVATLGIGAALLVVGLLLWVGIAATATGRGPTRHSPSSASETIARRVPGTAASTGARFALSSRNGSTAGTFVTLAVIVAGIVGATGFAVSLDRLVSDRARFGDNYSFGLGDNSPVTADQLRAKLKNDPDIAAMSILTSGGARAGKVTVQLVGVEHVVGDLAPRLTQGRLPDSPDEIALGRLTAHQLHVAVGDRLGLTGTGAPIGYRVVGITVVPGIGGVDGVGTGAVVTAEALRDLQGDAETTMAAISVRPGAGDAARVRIDTRVGAEGGQESEPSVIVNVARVRRVPAFLASLLAALLLLTLFHTLITSIQNRRRDLAVLRALGADHRWIGRTVHWQTSILTVMPLVVGVPLGLVAGAAAFRAFTNRIGAFPEPAIPLALVAAMALALIVIANLVAVVPTRRARRLSTAQLLRAD
jgi:putative ABC transport system permease protein